MKIDCFKIISVNETIISTGYILKTNKEISLNFFLVNSNSQHRYTCNILIIARSCTGDDWIRFLCLRYPSRLSAFMCMSARAEFFFVFYEIKTSETMSILLFLFLLSVFIPLTLQEYFAKDSHEFFKNNFPSHKPVHPHVIKNKKKKKRKKKKRPERV